MITITNNNIYYSDVSTNYLNSFEDVTKINPREIVNFLSEQVELGESLTFKRLFDIASFNVEKFHFIFYSSMGGYSLSPFLQEIENNPTEIFDVDYLELYWVCDRYQNELNLYPMLHGVNVEKKEYYAMDFVSLNNIKDCNIRINKRVEIFNLKLNDAEESDRYYLGEKSFTLFELYNCILHEITFHGGPQDKKEILLGLEQSLVEIEENMENIDDVDNITVSFDNWTDNIIENFESKDEYLVKYKDLKTRVDKDRVTNENNLEKLKACLLEKLKIYDTINNSDENLSQYYKKLTDIEYDMQLLYGEDEDISHHKFWYTPKCTCPKIDNLEVYPSNKPFFNKDCPIHKDVNK